MSAPEAMPLFEDDKPVPAAEAAPDLHSVSLPETQQPDLPTRLTQLREAIAEQEAAMDRQEASDPRGYDNSRYHKEQLETELQRLEQLDEADIARQQSHTAEAEAIQRGETGQPSGDDVDPADYRHLDPSR